jgi:hypothetical protein
MLSEKLTTLLAHMELNVVTATEKEAVKGARMRLTKESASTACLRCSKADWFGQFAPLNGQYEWVFLLARCGAGMVLLPHAETHGLMLPKFRFCSGQCENKSESHCNESTSLAAISQFTTTKESNKSFHRFGCE